MAFRALLLVALLLLGACAPKGIDEARSALRTNDLRTARALLEADRERAPGNVEVRLALGEVYYRIARDALDWERDEGRYLAFLERSVEEFTVAARLDPERPEPHFYMATMDVYRGDLDGALRGFENTLRLSRSPIAETNLAEVHIYRGDLVRASRWNQSGELSGAGRGPVTFNRMLMRWSEGDVDAARRDFETLRVHHPEMIRTINVAAVPLVPERFEQFAGYCCDSPACGPYLAHACRDLDLQVTQRQVSEETLLRELRIEMERRRRLGEIYRQRKELEIEVEVEAPTP
ncbi:MAG: hypothetical protein ACQGVC_24220 [Myxococcota bacterium]